MKSLTCYLLIVLQIYSSGCAHIPAGDSQTVSLTPPSQLQTITNTNLEIRYLIYEKSRLPLSEFFSRLGRGEYKESFRKIDLSYHPSNTDNEILEEMIDAGYIPIYIEIKNNGAAPIEITEKSFLIFNEQASLAPIKAEEVPQTIKRFSTQALVANIYNTGVVIVGFVAILAAVVASGANGSPDGGQRSPLSPNASDEVYNNLQHTTKLDYQNLLISPKTLNAGQTLKGLLFAYNPNSQDRSHYQLRYGNK